MDPIPDADVEALERALDDNPADRQTRMVLADRLDELAGGESPAGHAQRWMADHQKYPHLAGNNTWDWWAFRDTHADLSHRERLQNAWLDIPLFMLLTAAMCSTGWSAACAYREHPTRRDAESDLAGALWRQRHGETGSTHATEDA